jgi:hypothetical protein
MGVLAVAFATDSRYESRASIIRMRADVSSALHPIPLSATKALRDVLPLSLVVEGKMSVDGDFGSKAAARTVDGLSRSIDFIFRL